LNYLRLSAKHIIKILFLLFILISAAYAQDTNDVKGKNDTSFVMEKSPWGAVLRSAILPGLGQIYNQSYWKAPIVWGLSAWLIYNWIYNNNQYWINAKTYLQMLNNPNLYNQNSYDNLKNYYQSNRNVYRDQRDLFTIYMGITYVLQLFDAYVDSQLFDFTVQEDYHTGLPSISFRLKF